MLSRLILLSCAREISLVLEQTGADDEWVKAWQSGISSLVCQPIHTTAGCQMVETALAREFRVALDMLVGLARE